MTSYAMPPWLGTDTSHAYPAGGAPRPPTIAELLTDIHALDAEIHQTDNEIASQISPHNTGFVDYFWRPFVGYWDNAMREVYYYEHSAPRDTPPGVATAAMVLWGARLKYQTLRQEAKARWGFSLGTSTHTSVGFVSPWLGALFGMLGAGAAALSISAKRDEYRDADWIKRQHHREEEWKIMVDTAVQEALAQRDQEWQAIVAARDQAWAMRGSPGS